MAEESEGKIDTEKIICKHNPHGKKHGNGWIICRSQKRPGLLYDFNTITGEAVWRDPETVTHHAAIMDKSNIQFGCHEPTDPPVDPKPYRQHNATPSSSTPNIYNKQIINNQFPAKTFSVDPYGNACTPYGLLNPNNAIGMSAPVWVAQTPPVLIGPSVTSLNQLPTIYGGLENIHFQNQSVTLSNRFQILKQMKNERLAGPDFLDGGGSKQNFQNCNYFPPRQGRNLVNRQLNRPNDLRSLLSKRRRQDLQSDAEVTDNPDMKEDVSTWVTEDDLNPDDTDKWLEAHTDGEGKKLNVDVGCVWDLADSSASRDCWFIIPTTRALLNNMRFLTSLVISDEHLRLLAPRDVVRALRSAAFSDDGRLADCASRSRTFVIRQMSKIPNSLKDAANFKSCRELIGPNTHVVHLLDEKDIPNIEITNSLQITAAKLKRHLESKMNSKPKTVSRIQNILKNDQILVKNDEPKEAESLPRFNPISSKTTQLTVTEKVEHKEQDLINVEKTELKQTEIRTEPTTQPPKLTANACCQTDFHFILTDSEIQPKEMNISQVAGPVEASKDSIATKAPTRKIRLRRLQSASTGSQSDEKKPFRWRKRKDISLSSTEMPSQTENSNKSFSRGSSPPPSSTSDLLVQQNDNAVDCGRSDFSVQVKIVDESSSSAVISNSIDSETMFKINKEAILSESKKEKKEEIVMYEITSECMEDRLSMRCDEWVSRFVQIMEEVLSQVLLLDPPFMDSTLPPPWTFQEATASVKRKFKTHAIIVDASEKLDDFLMKIKYDRGNLGTRISSTDFMLMYSYGVNIVNKLQVVLKNCEDLHIASQNLSKLLSDIREPNLDESYEMENLNCDDPMCSPNISETVTNATIDYTAPTTKKSPQKQTKNISCNISPARYTLRSNRSVEKKGEEDTEAVNRQNKDYTLFAALGLQKNKFRLEKCFNKTIFNSPKIQEPLTPPGKKLQESVKNVQENNAAQVEPKIIRNFSICPEIEKKLKGINCGNNEDDQNDADYAYDADDNGADDCAVDDYAAEDYTADDHAGNDCVTDDHIEFEGDGNVDAEPHIDDNYNDLLPTTAMNDNQNFDNTKSGDINANRILKLVVHITTYKYRRWLAELHKFCEVTNRALKSEDCSLTKYQINMMEKTIKVRENAKNVCNRLKSVLNRDPCVTSYKFRGLMKDYGIQDFDMNDTQLAEYRVIIEKYLELAEQLSICVTRLTDAVNSK